MEITVNTSIEDILESVPESVQLLQQKGIKCIACGEPVWGTLQDAAKIKNITDEQLEKIIQELNDMLNR